MYYILYRHKPNFGNGRTHTLVYSQTKTRIKEVIEEFKSYNTTHNFHYVSKTEIIDYFPFIPNDTDFYPASIEDIEPFYYTIN